MENIYCAKLSIFQDIENEVSTNNDINLSTCSIDENSQVFILKISCSKDDNYEKESAYLSDFNDLLLNKFDKKSLKLIFSDHSAYYTKQLYPLLNDIEHMLRQFIIVNYLKLHSQDDIGDYFERLDLEHKDFGEIYDIYFLNEKFYKNVLKEINNNGNRKFILDKKFTKQELLNVINEIPDDESTWDKFNADVTVPSLKDNYKIFKEIRNEVMHAHYLSKNTFDEYFTLIDTIHKEFENANKMAFKNVSPSLSNNSLTNKNNAPLVREKTIEHVADQLAPSIIEFSKTMNDIVIPKETLSGLISIANTIQNIVPEGFGKNLANLEIPDEYFENLKKLQSNVASIKDEGIILSCDEIIDISQHNKNFSKHIQLDKDKVILLVSLNKKFSSYDWDDQSLGNWVISQDKMNKIQYIFGIDSSNKRLVSIVEVTQPKQVEGTRIRFLCKEQIYLYSKYQIEEAPYVLREALDWNNQNPIKYIN